MGLPPIEIDRETFLKNHFMLPPLPAVVARVLQAILCDRASATEIANLLSADPGLVAQLLKIANSAYYGLPNRISDVKHAIAYLGLAEIERLALTASVMRYASPAESDEFHHFWYHSFYTALISKLLAREYLKGVDAEGIYSSALLHDVGKLVYMKFFPDHFREMMNYCQSSGGLLADAERHFGLPSHGLIGSILCNRWLIPDIVKRACEQHEPEHLQGLDDSSRWHGELQLVCLANLLSNLAAESLSDDRKNAFREMTLQTLACSEQDFLLLMGQVYELKPEVEHFLTDV